MLNRPICLWFDIKGNPTILMQEMIGNVRILCRLVLFSDSIFDKMKTVHISRLVNRWQLIWNLISFIWSSRPRTVVVTSLSSERLQSPISINEIIVNKSQQKKSMYRIVEANDPHINEKFLFSNMKKRIFEIFLLRSS